MQKFSFKALSDGAKTLAGSRDFRYGVFGVIILVAISLAFFATSLGDTLQQSDTMQGVANGQEAKAYFEQTGEKTCWTNSLFGGMPTFQISPSYASSKFISALQSVFGLGLPSPANLVFMMMAGFYILLLAMRQRWYLALLGAIAYGFSSYFFILIGAGHIWKFCVLAYVPPTIAGIVLAYRGKWLAGGALTAVFAMLQIASNHVQMTYYFLFVVVAMMIAYFVDSRRKKELGKWLKATGVLAVAAVVAVGANLTSLYNTYEYSKETVRGRTTDLTAAKSSGESGNVNKNGINRDNVTSWSYGVDETLTLIIPNVKGGATVKPNDITDDGGLAPASVIDLDKAQSLVEAAQITGDPSYDEQLRPQLQQMVGQFRQYFGDQPMTNGPVYVGVVIFALALLALFVVKGPMKWALLAVSILSILLSWGHNFSPLTYWMIDHFPMYDKFRAPASILVIVEFTLPILAVMAVNQILTEENFFKKHRNAVFAAFGIPALFCVIGWLMPSVFGNGLSVGEAEQLEEILAQTSGMEHDFYSRAFSIVGEARLSMVAADSLRSLLLLAVGAVLLLAYVKGKLSRNVFVGVLIAVVLVDMFQVDKRYINEDMFVKHTEDDALTFIPTSADSQILQDKSYYRVSDVRNFGSPNPSFFHKSVGGYHAAKLTRYNDIISKMLQPTNGVILGMKQTYGTVDLSLVDMKAYNMLNTKYLIVDGKVLTNPGALGNAWLVDNVEYAEGADAEMDALQKLNPAVKAVADVKFKPVLGTAAPKQPGDTIYLTSYKPNELRYKSQTGNDAVAVFSEVYFPWGWTATVDGKELPIARVDYTLRGMRLPAGSHEIVMRFDPKSIHTTETVAYTSITLVYLALIVVLIATVAAYGRRKEQL